MQTNDYDLVDISERGEGQENECPICGAEANQFCSEPIEGTMFGVELGRQVHRARLRSNAKVSGLRRPYGEAPLERWVSRRITSADFLRGKTMTTWQREAVAWLRGKAAEQAQNNERWPEHAKCYPTWVEREKTTRRLADELEREAEEVTT